MADLKQATGEDQSAEGVAGKKGAFVDSSQAGMLLELLRTNAESKSQTSDLDTDPMGIESSVSKLASNLQSVAIAMTGARNKVATNGYSVFEADRKPDDAEKLFYSKAVTKEGLPQLFFCMLNQDLRKLLDLAMGGSSNADEIADGPLRQSEVQFLCLFADKYFQQVYTAREAIENFPLPGRIVSSSFEDVVDLVETGEELVCVDLVISFADTKLGVKVLIPIEYLQSVTLVSDQADEDTLPAELPEKEPEHVRAGIVPISTACEFFSAEMSIASIRQLQVGEMLTADIPLTIASLVDADGNCILTGTISLAKQRFALSGISSRGKNDDD